MAANLSQTVANSLRRLREVRGLTQAEVAEDVGIAVEAYGRLERAASLPRADTLVLLSKALGATCDEILGLASGAQLTSASSARMRATTHRLQQLDEAGVRLVNAVAAELLRRGRKRA